MNLHLYMAAKAAATRLLYHAYLAECPPAEPPVIMPLLHVTGQADDAQHDLPAAAGRSPLAVIGNDGIRRRRGGKAGGR